MMRGTAAPAVLRKDWKAVAAVSVAFCDSVFQLPPRLLEAAFLCPVGARASVRAASACEKADRVNYYKVL